MKKIFIFLVCIFSVPFILNAKELKIDFVKDFGGSASEQFVSNVMDSEQNIINVGITSSTDIDGLTNKGSNDGIITKYDKEGNLIWKRIFGRSGIDYFCDVVVDSEDSYIVVGYTASNDIEGLSHNGGNDGLIVKYDKDGNIVWQRLFGGSSYDYFHAVANTSNDGVIIGGEFNSTDIEGLTHYGGNDALLIKYDKDGNVTWMKSWGGNEYEYFYSIDTSSNGDIAVVGGFDSTDIEGLVDNGMGDSIIIKYNESGDIIWRQAWGGNQTETLQSVLISDDGSVYTVGRSYSQKTRAAVSRYAHAGVILKFGNDGNLVWERDLGFDLGTAFRDLALANDGGVYVVGTSMGLEYEGVAPYGGSDAYFIKYDKDGNITWMKNWGGTGNEDFYSIFDTNNNYILISGYSSSIDIEGLSNKGTSDSIFLKYFTEYNFDNVETVNGTSIVEQNGKYGIVKPEPNEGFEVDTVIIKDSLGNEISVVSLEDGTYSFELYDDVSVEVLFKEIIENPKTFDSSFAIILISLFFGVIVTLIFLFIYKNDRVSVEL